MKKGNAKLLVFVFIISVALLCVFSVTFARYTINFKQNISVSSCTSNVNISIDKTTANILTKDATDQLIVTIENNNSYDIYYTIKTENTRLEISGCVTEVLLKANNKIEIPLTVSQNSNIIYTTISDSMDVVVDIIKPYKINKNFNITVNTSNYNLEELILAHNSLKTTTPNFKENVTTSASSGMFKTTDESGDTYYFRGVVENNYVSFAGMTWRIIRINGDGSYRLILNNATGTSSYATTVSTTYNNIGYMYAKASTPTANTYNSAIKTYLEDWYTNNLSSYDSYISKDAIFWNDRTIYSNDGNYVYYAGWNRIVNNSPSLVASTKADMFSVSTTKGNGKLSYPIGLINADEVVLAGATMTGATLGNFGTYYENRVNYLNLNETEPYGIWTMTPRRFVTNNPTNSHIVVSKPQAIIYSEPAYHATTKRYVKPVINLKSTIMCKGTGTEADPYLVRAEE